MLLTLIWQRADAERARRPEAYRRLRKTQKECSSGEDTSRGNIIKILKIIQIQLMILLLLIIIITIITIIILICILILILVTQIHLMTTILLKRLRSSLGCTACRADMSRRSCTMWSRMPKEPMLRSRIYMYLSLSLSLYIYIYICICVYIYIYT